MLILLPACGQNRVQQNVSRVFKDPLFRNQQMGNSYSMVMKSEESKWMLFPDSNMIKYHYQMSDSEDFHWAYIFTNDHLSQIYVESFLGSPQHADEYVDEISRRYHKTLGQPVKKGDVYEWKADSVVALLFNESKEANMGYIRMVFYKPGDSTITIHKKN